jgi:hypothetical protein
MMLTERVVRWVDANLSLASTDFAETVQDH